MNATASWISSSPDRCGGDACVRDTRITVWGLVAYRRQGLSDAAIRKAIQGVTEADLETAWDYAEKNREEIKRTLTDNEPGDEKFVE